MPASSSQLATAIIPDVFQLAGRYTTAQWDRVQWLRSGIVNYMGRMDFQVKLNGQRLETSEIEVVLRAVNGIQDALVVLSGEPPRLNAYLIATNDK